MKRRRYVPLSVRVQVAERQFDAATSFAHENGDRHATVFRSFVDRDQWRAGTPLQRQLYLLLQLLFGDAKTELHHRPALVNRPLNRRKTDTVPPANDPEHLVYLLKDEEHRIETYVRGVGAQRSDVSQRRYLKRVAKNRSSPKKRVRRTSRGFPKRSSQLKHRAWPKGRKLRWRA